MILTFGTDWGSYLAWNKAIQFDWPTLRSKLNIGFAVYRGDQEQISDAGNYSTMDNLAASRAAGVPVNACYYWHYPVANQTYYIQRYAQAIEREQPDFIGIDIEQMTMDGIFVTPTLLSDTAQQLCEGLAALFPNLRLVVYTREGIIDYAPKIQGWIGQFDTWPAGWPDYGQQVYSLTWEQIAAGVVKNQGGQLVNIHDYDVPILSGAEPAKIWQYSSRIMPPTQGFPFDHQYDWNVFYGSVNDMLVWVGKETTMTTLFNTAVLQTARAKVFTYNSGQKLLAGVTPSDLGADLVILPMGGMDWWDGSHMRLYTESSFRGRHAEFTGDGVPVGGKFVLTGGYWLKEQHGAGEVIAQSCGGEMDEAAKKVSARGNLALPFLLNAWCGSWSWDAIFAKTQTFADIKFLELDMTDVEGFAGAGIGDYWQTITFKHMAQPLNWLKLRGYIPNVPIVLYSGPWFLALYPAGEFAQMLTNAASWLYLRLGQWTLTSTATFPTLAEIYAFRPAETFAFSTLPDGYFERVWMHEYSGEKQKCAQLVDKNGAPTFVNLSLWNDTAEVMLETLGADIPPIEPPADWKPRVEALETKVTALEAENVKLWAEVASLDAWRAEMAKIVWPK